MEQHRCGRGGEKVVGTRLGVEVGCSCASLPKEDGILSARINFCSLGEASRPRRLMSHPS